MRALHRRARPGWHTRLATIGGMTSPGLPAIPEAAIAWLCPRPVAESRVLVLGRASAPVAEALAAARASLVATDTSRGGLRTLMHRAPVALPTVARPDRLPFIPCAFDAVFIHQWFQDLDAAAVLPELARVLAPAGHLALSWTIRDDSVPWVRRLATLMRSVDPTVMTGDYGTHTTEALDDSPFFTDVELRRHRLWVPIARVDLLAMVANRFPDLEPDRLAELLADVGALYEASARPPTPLLLPYAVACWRARVDHSEFTSQIRLPDEGLPISL